MWVPLQQRIQLQHQYQQTCHVADMQGLTDNGHITSRKSHRIFLNVVADYLAVSIDPSATICLPSSLPALAELTMYYSNLVSISRLERNPTVKNEINQKHLVAVPFQQAFKHPISQAVADITAFPAA